MATHKEEIRLYQGNRQQAEIRATYKRTKQPLDAITFPLHLTEHYKHPNELLTGRQAAAPTDDDLQVALIRQPHRPAKAFDLNEPATAPGPRWVHHLHHEQHLFIEPALYHHQAAGVDSYRQRIP